jgi:deazaflavin-dependent oxidoreductase (nitroreductase family)
MDFKEWNKQIIKEFRENDGKVGGQFEGAPLILLHTTGAKSGEERINPLMTLPKGDDIVVFASMAGAPRNPDWFHNLVANPDVTVEVGTDTKQMRARVADRAERDALYAEQAAAYPQFAEYEANTDRVIPVVVLSPA